MLSEAAQICRKVELDLLLQIHGAKPRKTQPMTAREATIQAHVELGMSREDAEMRAKFSDAVLPDGAALSHSPVKPGHEREFIEELKLIYRKIDATPGARQAVPAEVAKRVGKN